MVGGGFAVVVLLVVIGAALGSKDEKVATTSPTTADVGPTTGASPGTASTTAATATTARPTTIKPTTTARPTTTAAPTTTVAPQQALHFEGAGPTVFTLDGLTTRAVTVTLSHNGSRNFIVDTYDAKGQRDGSQANEIGTFTGTVLLDDYKLDGPPPQSMQVEADGAWTIDIQPLGAAPAWDGVSPLVGAGQQVYIVPSKTKAQRVTLTHDGKRNFIVSAYSTAAGSSIGLVNEIGPYNGQKMMAKDVVLIAVQADGNWSITPG